MKLTSLGHSAYLLEMEGTRETPLRLLADPWLSDLLIGDLLGRFPRVRLDHSALSPLDAIYISHSHTDHLDPYTLLPLWRALDPKPAVLLPESLRYLRSLFEEYLDGVELIFLRHHEPIEIGGVQVRGFFNPEQRPTNEDDVMVLVADSGREVFLCESDAVLPFYDPGARAEISALLEERETACFLTIKNEGDATFSMLSAKDPADRQARLSRAIEALYGELYEMYEHADPEDLDPNLEDADFDDGDGPAAELWQNPNHIRLVGGQGICFPQGLETPWNRVLFPIRLEDRVRMEREVAEQFASKHTIEEFVPGRQFVLRSGGIESTAECGWLELLDKEEERQFDPELNHFDTFPVAPLCDEVRAVEAQRATLMDLLNGRFLPHLIGARRPPVEHLLGNSGGEFRIRLRFGTVADSKDLDYCLRFDQLRFVEEEPTDAPPNEFYWANDLDDVLVGRADEFSSFCRRPLGGTSLHLWSTLGLPYLNTDLIERKLRLHFARAASEETVEDWVLPFFSMT